MHNLASRQSSQKNLLDTESNKPEPQIILELQAFHAVDKVD